MALRYSWHVGVVTDTKLFNRTGDVGRWAEAVNVAYVSHARRHAPVDKRQNKSRANSMYPVGALAASIFGEVTRVGPRHLQTLIYVDVPYALYVIKGTSTIFAKAARAPAGSPGGIGGQFVPLEGRGMYIPANFGLKSRYAQRVRGQRANPFLDLAFDATARRHSSLRGYSMAH
jgi:hypothetical protein